MIKLKVTMKGVVPTQSYGNIQPEYTIEKDIPEDISPAGVEEELVQMREIVEGLYSERDKQFRELMEKKSSKGDGATLALLRPLKVRWRNVGGKPYPGVTSILNPFGILDDEMLANGWTEEEMNMYALRGTIVHWQIESYLRDGQWPNPKDHPGYPMLAAFKSTREGAKPIRVEDCNPAGFFGQYEKDFTFTGGEEEVISKEHQFAGRFDLIGIREEKDKGTPGVYDVKTSSSYGTEKKDQYFTQMAGYDIALIEDGKMPAKEYIIFPINPSNKQGYGAPIITTDTEKYKAMFLAKVEEFYALPEIIKYLKENA